MERAQEQEQRRSRHGRDTATLDTPRSGYRRSWRAAVGAAAQERGLEGARPRRHDEWAPASISQPWRGPTGERPCASAPRPHVRTLNVRTAPAAAARSLAARRLLGVMRRPASGRRALRRRRAREKRASWPVRRDCPRAQHVDAGRQQQRRRRRGALARCSGTWRASVRSGEAAADLPGSGPRKQGGDRSCLGGRSSPVAGNLLGRPPR